MLPLKSVIIKLIMYGSYLSFPFLLWMFWIWKNGWHGKDLKTVFSKTFVVFLICLSLLFIYMRFVERYFIIVRHEEIVPELKGVRIALVSDIHIGIYKGENFLISVVKKLNEIDADFVLLPGDFVYGMDSENLNEAFLALNDLNMPVYAVLGNHDLKPRDTSHKTMGEFRKNEMYEALEAGGVVMVDNYLESVDVVLKDGSERSISLIGVGSLRGEDDKYGLLEGLVEGGGEENDATIVMVHNPDAIFNFPDGLDKAVNLVVAGHTHGGQIRIPWLYKKAIPCNYAFDRGWHAVNSLKVFVSSGVGETGLPLRLFNPPEIVVFE